jgi:hypothetical protein
VPQACGPLEPGPACPPRGGRTMGTGASLPNPRMQPTGRRAPGRATVADRRRAVAAARRGQLVRFSGSGGASWRS